MRTSTLLDALSIMRNSYPQMSFSMWECFLMVANNTPKGVTMRDVIDLSSMTRTTASRSMRALCKKEDAGDSAVTMGLLITQDCSEDAKKRRFLLSEEGKEIMKRFSRL